MKTIFIFTVVVILFNSVIAQPIIELDGLTPEFGETITFQSTGFTDTGSPGPNQEWDFSNLTSIGSSTITYYQPQGQPGSEDFPDATHAVDDDNSEFSRIYLSYANDEATLLGYYFADEGVAQYYNDPRLQFEFPLEYGDTFSDSFSSEGQLGPLEINEEGMAMMEVNGYGTLTTPSGSFEDVLRIRYEQDYTRTVIESGQVVEETQVVQTSYYFVKSGYHESLLTLTEQNTDGDVNTYGTYYSNSTVGDQEGPEEIREVKTYPNPANDYLNLQANLDKASNAAISLLDMHGSVVKAWGNENLNPGQNSIKLQLNGIEPGIYFLEIREDRNSQLVQKKVVIQ